jgi:DNA-binding CsgD family transcriptional regulator
MEPQRLFAIGDEPGLRVSSSTPVDPTAVLAALTPRQRDVATLLVGTGLSYKEIATRLGLREGTVRSHTEKVYRALGVHSRAELTAAFRAALDAFSSEVPPAARQALPSQRRHESVRAELPARPQAPRPRGRGGRG